MARRKPPVRRRSAQTDDTPTPAPQAAPAPVAEPAPIPPAKRSPGSVTGDRVARPKARTVGRQDRDVTPREADVPTGLGALEALVQGGIDMAALVGESSAAPRLPEVGSRMEGTLLRPSGQEWVVDLGQGVEGWIAARDVEGGEVGDPVTAFVLATEEQTVQLSTKLSGQAAGAFLEEAVEAGIPVEGTITARTGPGFTVRIGPARAFLPISQASRLPVQDPDILVGTTTTFRVLEHGDKTVVSRRVLEEEAVEATRAERLAALREGDVVDAVVTSVQTWGAFLDVDGVDMRLPKREFDWDEPEDLTTRLDRGQTLRVRVVDMRDGRITASCKDPSLDPWNDAANQIPVGGVVSGPVVSVADFGAFVRIAPGVDGLVHRSKLSRVPSQGDTLEVRILSVDPSARRVELQPADAPPPEPDETAEVRAALAQQGSGSMGTLGDLLGAYRDKLKGG